MGKKARAKRQRLIDRLGGRKPLKCSCGKELVPKRHRFDSREEAILFRYHFKCPDCGQEWHTSPVLDPVKHGLIADKYMDHVGRVLAEKYVPRAEIEDEIEQRRRMG